MFLIFRLSVGLQRFGDTLSGETCTCSDFIGELRGESQSRTQSPRASWSAGERPERLWDNRLHFPRKRGFRSYYVCLSLTGNRKEKTVNSTNGGLKVFKKQEF